MTTKAQKQDKNKLAEIDENISKLFDIKKRLGKGAYGIVWKAMDKRTNETLAVKKIFDAFRDETDAQRTFREIIFLKAFRNHPNVIKLQNVYKASNNLDIYLIFEYMESDLHNIIKKGSILKDIHKRYVMYQLINAIGYIHSGNVIHRDLKPSNVLIDSKCRCKLADFGLARSVSNRPLREGCQDVSEPIVEPLLTDYVATRWYRAPEILVASKRYTKGIDMWSLGCILGEMIRGKPIFQGTSTVNQIEKIVTALPDITEHDINAVGAGFGSVLLSKQISRERKTSLDELLLDAPEDALNLVKSLLVLDPLSRLTAKQALTHPYVEKFRNSIPEIELSVDILPPFRDDVRLTVPEYRSKLYEIVQVNTNSANKASMHSINSSGSSSTNASKHREYRSQQTQQDLKGRSSSKPKHNYTAEKSVPIRKPAADHQEVDVESTNALNKALRTRCSPLPKRRSSRNRASTTNATASGPNASIINVSSSSTAKFIVAPNLLQKTSHQPDERAQIVIPRSKVAYTKHNEPLEDAARTTHNTSIYAGFEKRHSIDCAYASLPPNGLLKQLSPDGSTVYKHDISVKLYKSSSSLHRSSHHLQHEDSREHKLKSGKDEPSERLHRSTPAVGHENVRTVGINIVRETKSDLGSMNSGGTALSSASSSCASKANDRICYEHRLKKLEEEIEKYKKEVKSFCKETYHYSIRKQPPPRPSTTTHTLPHPRMHHNQMRSGKHGDTIRMLNLPPMNAYLKLPERTSQFEYELTSGSGGGGRGSGDHIGRGNNLKQRNKDCKSSSYQQHTQYHQRVKPISKFI